MDEPLEPEAEKPNRPMKRRPLFPPDADVPNPMGLSTAEINEGLDDLIEFNRDWKRLQAERAAAAKAAESLPHTEKPTA